MGATLSMKQQLVVIKMIRNKKSTQTKVNPAINGSAYASPARAGRKEGWGGGVVHSVQQLVISAPLHPHPHPWPSPSPHVNLNLSPSPNANLNHNPNCEHQT